MGALPAGEFPLRGVPRFDAVVLVSCKTFLPDVLCSSTHNVEHIYIPHKRESDWLFAQLGAEMRCPSPRLILPGKIGGSIAHPPKQWSSQDSHYHIGVEQPL